MAITLPPLCPGCGCAGTSETIELTTFEYEQADGPAIELQASLPTIYCTKCETSFTDWRADVIMAVVRQFAVNVRHDQRGQE